MLIAVTFSKFLEGSEPLQFDELVSDEDEQIYLEAEMLEIQNGLKGEYLLEEKITPTSSCPHSTEDYNLLTQLQKEEEKIGSAVLQAEDKRIENEDSDEGVDEVYVAEGFKLIYTPPDSPRSNTSNVLNRTSEDFDAPNSSAFSAQIKLMLQEEQEKQEYSHGTDDSNLKEEIMEDEYVDPDALWEEQWGVILIIFLKSSDTISYNVANTVILL